MVRLRIFIALAVLCPPPVFSQLPQVAESRLGVDSVKIEGGKRLYGFLLSRRVDQSLVFSVGRQWLETTYPQLFAEWTALERDRFVQSRQQRVERLAAWIENRPDDRRLVSFLEDELTRFSELRLEDVGRRKFVTIELPPSRYREIFSQPTDRRKIAGLAFQNDLDDVTTTPVSQLRKKLVELGVDVETENVNLSREVEATGESDRQWAARKAVVEYALRKQLEFQGTGSMLIRKTETPDASALVAQMLGGGLGEDPISQLGAELGLPEFQKPKEKSDGWWKRATEEAEREGFCGVSITRLNQNTLSSTVTVEAYFFAMEKPGIWFQVVRFASQANAAEQADEQLKRIHEDPQVKSVLDTLKGLGLGNQGLVDQALRHGAATQKALQDATGQFNAFVSQNARALDSQPIALQP